jgi:nitroreductase
MENMVVAATSEGLGTCWIGSFNEQDVKLALKIPENYKIVALLALGYPKKKMSTHPIKRRKRLSKIISFEEFGARVTTRKRKVDYSKR